MNTKPLLVAAAVALFATGTVTLAQFEMFKGPANQPSGQGSQQNGGFGQRGQDNGQQRNSNFQGDQKQGQGGQSDTRTFGDQGNNGGLSQEDQDKQQQQMDDQRFQSMKRGMKQFEQGFSMTKKMVQKMKPKLDKCGVAMPLELTQAIDLGPGVIT